MYRAYIAQRKYGVVVNDISSSSLPQLQYIRMLAVFCSGDADRRYNILNIIFQTKVSIILKL